MIFVMFSLINIDSHVLQLKFLQGLTREIRENKTTAKISTYTVNMAPTTNLSLASCSRGHLTLW